MTQPLPDPDFADLLDRDVIAAAPAAADNPPDPAWLATLARLVLADGNRAADRPRRMIEALIAGIDTTLDAQINVILHAPAFQELEASWRGLYMLVRRADRDAGAKVKTLNISKRELALVLRKFRGNAWDQSPIFRRIYEDEFGQFGGEPYGLLIGDYAFDQRPEDVGLLSDVARIAAAAHAPFIAAASPYLLQMDSWAEIANPRDLARIFLTPEYIPWRALREQEDVRYVGLCMPRFLARLPYGAATDPLDGFAFEEETDGPDTSRLLWGNPAYAFGANVVSAFVTYGWCVRIRGIDRGGIVEDLPVLRHSTADGDVDRRTVTEICLSERRDAELASCGLIPLVHRKNSDVAAFISAQSLQKPQVYDDPDATANANLSARLPYLLACCRFAHYLKAMVRDKVGSTLSRTQLTAWLSEWLLGYVDGAPATSPEEFKAAHPLADARVVLQDRDDMPGAYDARVFLRPHYQLEGLSVVLRLVSRMERTPTGAV
jgi:type VI secretion system protein ImpC